MKHRPAAIAIDVLGTLFDFHALTFRFEHAGLKAEHAELWMTRILRDGFALEASGTFRAFTTIASGHAKALLEEHGLSATRRDVRTITDGLEELPLHPDVRAGLDALHCADMPLAALTNGAEETTRAMLDRVGYAEHFDHILSISDVGHWKPMHRPYRYAATVLGEPPRNIALIAAHPWDIHGAAKAGLMTGWVNRKGITYPEFMAQPDEQGQSFGAVAQCFLAQQPWRVEVEMADSK